MYKSTNKQTTLANNKKKRNLEMVSHGGKFSSLAVDLHLAKKASQIVFHPRPKVCFVVKSWFNKLQSLDNLFSCNLSVC